MAVIYRITNMANGKFYIGSAESFERRKWQHTYDLKRGRHKNPHLQASWNKHGEEMFVFEILETLQDTEQVFDAENRYLHKFVGQPDCYNINTDAHRPRLGTTHTEETKELLRRAKLENPTRAWLGKSRSEETRAKISAAQKGRPSPRKGMKMSEQGRANVAAAVKRGKDSHFYGKRPANVDAMCRPIYVIKPDGTRETYPGLSYMRDNLGVSVATIIRACKSGKPVQTGTASGWRMSYEPVEVATLPAEYANLPRTRQLAKEQGAKYYFTGEPCTHGHVAPRKVKGACIECAKIEGQKANDRARQKKLLPWLTYARDGATAKFVVVHTDAKEAQRSEFPGTLKLLRIDAGVWHIETEVHWIPEDVEMAIVELIRGKAADEYWKAARAFFPPKTIRALRRLAVAQAKCHNQPSEINLPTDRFGGLPQDSRRN
jgi:group I intron endonuclease